MKRSATFSLVGSCGFALLALSTKRILELEWYASADVATVTTAGVVTLGLLLSDAFGHVLLRRIRGVAYTNEFDRFTRYFSSQSTAAVLASGILASAEELVYRGVLVAALVQMADAPVALAVLVSALLFGLSHVTLDESHPGFAVWATWEGVLLGVAYVLSGSILVVGIAHALHDVAGFVIFRLHREGGTLGVGRVTG